jgi:TonB family protein
MSAATSLALDSPAVGSLALNTTPRRGSPRYPLTVPVDVIALRSGMPITLPGRCADVSEGGMAAIVAGDLCQGQEVAIELRLPNVGMPLRAKAVVRYQGPIRFGMEFIGLATEQVEMIRYWTQRLATISATAEQAADERCEKPVLALMDTVKAAPQKAVKIRVVRRGFEVLLAAMLLCAAGGWWQWRRSWRELEGGSANQTLPVRVSPETMTAQIVSKTEPTYPEEARRAGTQGMVVLDTLIATDGTVKRLRDISGDDVLAKAAMNAVQQWRFEPYRTSGRAAEVETTISVDFRLN